MTDLDLERLPHEINHALDAAGILTDQLEPATLRVHNDGDHLDVTDRHGTPLCRVPLHRLTEVDPALIRGALEDGLDQYPVDVADQIRAALRDSPPPTFEDMPNADWIVVQPSGCPPLSLHRSTVVHGWPA